MIKGKKVQPKVFVDKPVVNYRKLDALNQTMLKVFDNDPVKFYEEFKLGKPRKEKKNLAFVIGDLVDFFLLDCKADESEFENRFDEKFALMEGVKSSAQVFTLADYIFEETEKYTNDKGEITISFEERFKAAYDRITGEGKYKDARSETGFKDPDKVMEDFEKNGKDYFDTRLANIGKTIVDLGVIEKAKALGLAMIKDPFTKDLFNSHLFAETEWLSHFPIEWSYELSETRSIPCKSELDILIIDHADKIIQPADLKTTYDNESFDYMYVKNAYYLQNAFYHKAVSVWAKREGLEKYTVLPLKFVVGDTSSNNRRPLVYETSAIDLERGMQGFSLRGVYYRGVNELIRDIAWAEQNDIWNCSREAFERRGQMKLKIDYE